MEVLFHIIWCRFCFLVSFSVLGAKIVSFSVKTVSFSSLSVKIVSSSFRRVSFSVR